MTMLNQFHSHDAEQGVLGGLMLLGMNGSTPTIDSVLGKLQPTDFHNPDNREIYRAMRSLQNRNQNIDPMTVSDEIERNGNAAITGGLGYIGTIARNTPSAANIHSYTRIIKEKSLERETMVKLQEAMQALTGQGDTQGKLETINSLMTTIQVDSNSTKGLTKIGDFASSWLDLYEERFTNPDLKGLTTGISSLDEIFGARGVNQTDLVVLGARPKMGKTQMAVRWSEHVALDQSKPVAIFSMEMTKEQVLERQLSQSANLPTDAFYRVMKDEEFGRVSHALGNLANADIYIDDRTNLSLAQIKSECRKLKATHGHIGLVVVDYLTLMKPEKADRTDLAYGLISKGLKDMAKELNTPVLLLAQLSRAVEQRANKRPLPSDLRESGQIEQDADRIIFLYRDEVYNPDSPSKGLTEAIVSVNRHGGTGTAYMTMANGAFQDITTQEVARMTAAQPKPYKKAGGFE